MQCWEYLAEEGGVTHLFLIGKNLRQELLVFNNNGNLHFPFFNSERNCRVGFWIAIFPPNIEGVENLSNTYILFL